MNNNELSKIIEELVNNPKIKSFKITWDGNLGEYAGEIVKPIIKIKKFK